MVPNPIGFPFSPVVPLLFKQDSRTSSGITVFEIAAGHSTVCCASILFGSTAAEDENLVMYLYMQ